MARYSLGVPINNGIRSGDDAYHLLAASIGTHLRRWARKYGEVFNDVEYFSELCTTLLLGLINKEHTMPVIFATTVLKRYQ